MTVLNGVINKVAPHTVIGINGGTVGDYNGARQYLYDKWRMMWNGNHLAPPDVGCVLYLPGYPGQGSIIQDFSGQGLDGTITGATWTQLPSGLWVMNFDGTDDTVTIADAPSLNSTLGMTWEVWWHGQGSFGDGDFSHVWSKGANSQWYMRLEKANGQIRVYQDIGGLKSANFATAVTATQWWHIVFTYDGTNRRGYLNGVQDLDVATATGAMGITTSALLLGTGAGTFLSGYLWVRMSNYALTAGQILQYYESTKRWFEVNV